MNILKIISDANKLSGSSQIGFPGPTAKKNDLNIAEPAPTKNEMPYVWNLVIDEMIDRDRIGAEKYGTRLQAHNGRDALKDAYQEALDLVVYLRQAIYERDGK